VRLDRLPGGQSLSIERRETGEAMTAGVAAPTDTSVRRIERRQWWLFSSGIIVTIVLTVAIISFALPVLSPGADGTSL